MVRGLINKKKVMILERRVQALVKTKNFREFLANRITKC